MNCSHCNSPIEQEQSFCPVCGRSTTDHGIERPEGTVWDSIITKVVAATAGKYRLDRVLGQGGMGAVYLAHDLRLDRQVAIKIMAPSMMTTADAAERFRQEAITVAQLKHQHIVAVYSVEEADDVRFIIMEFVEGAPLEDVLATRGPLPPDVVRAWLAQTADALDCAHRRGIVHRDVKPANILLDRDGNAVLTDFGIAKAAEGPQLTQTGMTVGTPTYMSPEQCASSAVTSASDQYSLGIVAYEMLAGSPPFSGPTLTVLQAHIMQQPAPILSHRPDCPPELAALIERMLAKDPNDRWPSLADVVGEVHAPPHGRGSPLRGQMAALVLGGPGPAAGVRSDPEAETIKYDTDGLDDRTVKVDSGLAAVPPVEAAAAVPDEPRSAAVPTTKISAKKTGRSIGRRVALAASVLVIGFAGWYGLGLRAGAANDTTAADTSTAIASLSLAESTNAGGGQPVASGGEVPIEPPAQRREPDDGVDGTALFSLSQTTLAVGDSVFGRVTVGDTERGDVTWSVEQSGVAAVADGWILGVGPGETRITAATGGQRVSANVTVNPVVPRFVQVSAGASHTCGTTREARVYCWGRNDRSQVRAQIPDIQPVPMPLPGSFARVAPGGVMTCALDPVGVVQCWGEAMRVPSGRFQGLAAGLGHACALASGGGIACWGDNRFGQLGSSGGTGQMLTEEVDFVQVASGDQHSCGLSGDGRAFCWGDNRKGQTGVGGPTAGRLATTSVVEPLEVAGGYTDLVMLTAGTDHTCAMTRAGTALCWGGNDRGQLGDGTRTDRAAPRPVTRARGGTRLVFQMVAVGGAHSCGVAANDRLYCWGGNDEGQVGDGTTDDRVAPVLIDLGGAVSDVSLGTDHTCAVTAAGETLCWGSNEFGQLGDGSLNRRVNPVVPGRVRGGP